MKTALLTAAAALLLAAPAAGGPAKGRGTVIVCQGTAVVPVGAVFKRTIQAGLDAANALAADDVTIRICAGEYREDLEIRSTKRLRLAGTGTVTVRGTGAGQAVIAIRSACADACFGRTLLDDLDLAGKGGQKPYYGLFVENNRCATSEHFCAERYRTDVSFLDGEIRDVSVAVSAIGLVDLLFERSTIRRPKVGGISLARGGEAAVEGAGDVSCALSTSPRALINDASFLGGGAALYAQHSTATVLDATVTGNEAKVATARNIVVADCARLTVKRSTLAENSGEGIMHLYRSTVLVLSTRLEDNTTLYNGVVTLSSSSDVDLVDVTVRRNVSPASRAAVSVLHEEGRLDVRRSCFSKNTPADVRTPAGASAIGCNSFRYP